MTKHLAFSKYICFLVPQIDNNINAHVYDVEIAWHYVSKELYRINLKTPTYLFYLVHL